MLKSLVAKHSVVIIALATVVFGGCRSANKTPPIVTPYAQGRYPLPQPYGNPEYVPQTAGAPTSAPQSWNVEQTRTNDLQWAPRGTPGQYSTTTQPQTNLANSSESSDSVPFYSATTLPDVNPGAPLFPFSGGTSSGCKNGCCNH